MANKQFGDDVWIPCEDLEQRASEKAAREAVRDARDALRDKTKEVGVFTMGLGMISAALIVYTAMISQAPGANVSPLILLLLTPSALMVFAGICVLGSRTKLSVQLATLVVTIAFAGDALLSMNPIKWIFSAACLYLIWRTAGQAIRQLSDPPLPDDV